MQPENKLRRSTGLSDSEVLCDSAEKLIKKLGYFRELLSDPAQFKLVFRYAFDFARDKDQRSMDIETAKAMLALLLGKSWPLFSEFDEFLHQPKAPRVINKDQVSLQSLPIFTQSNLILTFYSTFKWNNIYEFSMLINHDLSNYSVDGGKCFIIRNPYKS